MTPDDQEAWEKMFRSMSKSNPALAGELFGVDPILHDLLQRERQRQYTEMLNAIDRVCTVIDSCRRSF